jgi:hypothetical protein
MEHEWQDWRNTELWTIEVNDVFWTNLSSLKRLHSSYINVGKKFFSVEDAIGMLTRDQQTLPVTTLQYKYAISFCKMTVKNESDEHSDY